MRKLGYADSEKLLKRFRIPSLKGGLATNEEQAASLARKLGYPVALKVSSPQIIHKTEMGGVLPDVRDESELRKGFRQILARARRVKGASLEGVIVQERGSGREVIVGSRQDPAFGPVLMFGLGGIFVEVLKDVSFRLIPLERKDAREMIKELRGRAILEGVRGEEPVDFRKLEDFLLSVSRMVQRSRLRELDINPAFASPEGVRAADVKVLA